MKGDKITVYETHWNEVPKWIDCSVRGIPFEKVNYYTAPLTKKKLRELLAKMNCRPAVLRTEHLRELGQEEEFTEERSFR